VTDPSAAWLAELDAELLAAGVCNFRAHELTTLPKARPPRADEPPRELWRNLIRVAILAQRVRDLYAAPLWVSSAWRPAWYNAAVDGASSSQHLTASAVDLNVLPSSRDARAIRRLERAGAVVYLEATELARGFGVYRGGRIHLDVNGARRTWGEASRVLDELESENLAQ
jgi:uncharacterized protein YcbK (DUF882 family)